MTGQGLYYRIVRLLVRLRYIRFHIEYLESPADDTVFICRHRNATGPLSTLSLMPLGIRPWAFSSFMDDESCVKHLGEYTFPVTWKLSNTSSRILAVILGKAFAALVRSSGAVPVYRQSLKVRQTFAQSVEVLEAGGRLLIFPDIDYTSQDGVAGALYEGFLLLEQIWYKKTGRHIRFVPVNVSLNNRKLTVGKAITFSGGKSFREESAEIARILEKTIDDMTKTYGT